MEGYILWFWAAARCAWLRPPDSAAPRWPRDDSSRSSRGSPVGMGLVYIYRYGDGSKPWYLVNPKIAGKWMFIPLKMYL